MGQAALIDWSQEVWLQVGALLVKGGRRLVAACVLHLKRNKMRLVSASDSLFNHCKYKTTLQ
jgi:hypothetical protein